MEDILLQSHRHVMAGRFSILPFFPGSLGGLPCALMTETTAVPGWEESQERLHLAFQAGPEQCANRCFHTGPGEGTSSSLPTESCHLISPPGLVRQRWTRPGQPAHCDPGHPRITQYGARPGKHLLCMDVPSLDSTCEYEYLLLETPNTHARLARGHSRNSVLRRRHPGSALGL